VAAFRPKDIHPCTVDPSTWSEDISIRRLFGHLCSGSDFAHDEFMRQSLEQTDDDDRPHKKRVRYEADVSTESTQSSSVLEEGYANIGDTNRKAPSTLDGTAEQTSDAGQPVKSQQSDFDPARAKRDEIRKARLYLQGYADPELLEIGPLPSSWPADEVTSQTPTSKAPSQGPRGSSFTTTGDGASSPHRTSQPSAESQQTDLLTLSISDSDLDASPPPDTGPARDIDQTTERTTEDRIASRRRARAAAYLAARDDSWTDVSLISAGGNHAEEEMEL
jgi:hypothetical protein